jgi:chemotaxis protein CheD
MSLAQPERAVASGRPRVGDVFAHIQMSWDAPLQMWNARILPGEYLAAGWELAISTVLGSCISACIRDPVSRVGGMNHFMLPADASGGTSSWLDTTAGLATRYGSFAMESLVNSLLKLGARRDRLEVKLFGGGKILAAMTDVGDRNIAFARSWLKAEGLPIVAADVGDTVPRRVIYIPKTGKVLLRHLRSLDSSAIASRETQYLTSVSQKGVGNDAELF